MIESKDKLLFGITKIIAENDSIAEGFGYRIKFTEELWQKELDLSSKVGWIDVAKEIIQLLKDKDRLKDRA